MPFVYEEQAPAAASGGRFVYEDGDKPAPPASRTALEIGQDLSASVLGGLVGVAKLPAAALDKAITGQWIGPGVTALNEFGSSVDDQKSAVLQAKERDAQAAVASAGQSVRDRFGDTGILPTAARIAAEFGVGAYEAVKDPTLLSASIAQQLPMLGASRIAGMGVDTAARAALPAAAAGTRAGQAVLNRAGTAGAVGAGAGMQATDIGSDTYSRLMALPDAQWLQVPGFKELAAQVGVDDAKDRMARDKAGRAAAMAGAASLASTALPGGSSLERALVGKASMGASPVRAVAKSVAGEAAQEGIEEGAGQVAGNLAVRDVLPTQDLAEGVGGAAGQGAALGGLMGGSATGMAALRQARAGQPAAAAPGQPTAPADPTAPLSADEILGQVDQAAAAATPADPAAPLQATAPLQPAAPPANPTTEPTAESALLQPRQLTSLDRVQQIDAELPAADPERAQALQTERASLTRDWPAITPGAETTFTTEAGARLQARYALVDATDLQTSHDTNLRKNPVYPPELQPRERDRAASAQQIAGISQKLDPARLGLSADATNGAPIVGADGLVESGNARTIALKRTYEADGLKADEYRAWLTANAQQFGLTAEAVQALQQPVLVRVRATPVDRAEFARQANADTIARMSPSEQARSDANRIDAMDDLQPDENGDFATSRDFIRRFMARLPQTEQSGMIDAAGALSASGYARVRNAVLAKAYGDSQVLARLTESMDDNMRNVSRALMIAAPRVAQARGAIQDGARFDADLTPHLVDAVEQLSRLKDSGTSVDDALAQAGIFGDTYSPETAALLRFLQDNIRRPRRMADFVAAYFDALDAAGDPRQTGMFGDETAPTTADLMGAAQRATTPPEGVPPNAASPAQDPQRRDNREAAPAGAGPAEQPADAQGNRGGDQGNGPAGPSTPQRGEPPAPGLTVAEAEAQVYAVREPGSTADVPLDLFPDTLEGLQAVPGQAGGVAPGRQAQPAAPGNVQPAAAVPAKAQGKAQGKAQAAPQPNTLAVREDPHLPGIYHYSTQLVEVGQRQLPVAKVTNWQQAASALASLRRYAVEHLDVLITDAAGKPLAIVGSFKGARAQTSAPPDTVLQEALRIKGAAHAWAVHNHPSELAELSQADRAVSNTMRTVFEASSVKWEGIAAIGGQQYHAASGRFSDTGDDDRGTVSEAKRGVTVPVVERTITPGNAGMPLINDPRLAVDVVRTASGGRTGIVFADSQHRLSAWVPMDPADMATLRKDGRFDKLINAAANAGAGAAFLANPNGAIPMRAQENIKAALNYAGVRLLDVIDTVTGQSAAERGLEPYAAGTVLSRAPRAQTRTPEFRAWFGRSQIVDADGQPRVMYHGTARDVTSFRPKQADAIFLTDEPIFAQAYADTSQKWMAYRGEQGGANIMPVYAKAERPFDFDNPQQVRAVVEEVARMNPGANLLTLADSITRGDWAVIEDDAQQAAIRALGFDSFYVEEGGFKNLGVYQSSQVKSAIGNAGSFDPMNPDIRLSQRRFFSALEQESGKAPMNAGTAQAWTQYLDALVKRGAVKADELEWTGLRDWLATQTGKVPKAQVLEFLKGNGVQVQEVVLSEGASVYSFTDLAGTVRRFDSKAEADAAFRAEQQWIEESVSVRDRGDLITVSSDGEGVLQTYRQQDDGTWQDDNDREFEDKYEAMAAAEQTGNVMRDGWRQNMSRSVEADESPSATKYSQYTLPGGTNYREVLLTLPQPARLPAGFAFKQMDGKTYIADERGYLVSSPYESESAALAGWMAKNEKAPGYRSGHWDQPNVLAHIRVNDRTDAEGRRVLFVEEIQSDWAQEGKRKGFDTQAAEAERASLQAEHAALQNEAFDLQRGKSYSDLTPAESKRLGEIRDRITAINNTIPLKGLPAAPFVDKTDKWVALALKRIIVMAAQEGYDRVAFVTGEQSAERYDLSKQVRSIAWTGRGNDTEKRVTITPNTGNDIELMVQPDGAVGSMGGRSIGNEFDGKTLDEIVGKDVAERIMGQPYGDMRGNGLKVGGEGMRAFYDKIVPSVAKDLLRKVGGGNLQTVAIAPEGNRWTVQFEDGSRGDPMTEREAREKEADDGGGAKAVPIEPMQQPGFDLTPTMREKAQSGLPLFSAGGKAPSTIPLPQLQAVAARIQAALPGLPPVKVLASPADLSKAGDEGSLRAFITERGADADVEGALHEGSIYLFASGIANEARAEHVLAQHEAAHAGLRGLLGADLPKTLQALANQNAQLRRAATSLMRSEPGMTLLEAVEETIVDMPPQALAELGGWRALVGKVRDWLAAHGFERMAARVDRWLSGTLAEQQRADLLVADLVRAARAHVAGRMVQAQAVATRFSRTAPGTEAFKRWFGNSQVVDANGKPLVVYHGTKSAQTFDAFKPSPAGLIFFSPDRSYARILANGSEDRIIPAYLAASNLMREVDLDAFEFSNAPENRLFWQSVRAQGYDGAVSNDGEQFVVFASEQVRRADGNPATRLSRAGASAGTGNTTQPPAVAAAQAASPNPWTRAKAKLAQLLDPEAIDKLIYEFQDKFIDLKRLREHIKAIGGTITDLNDAYQGEELYHKRLAKRTEDFLANELKPLLADLRNRSVSIEDFERYLHARHAPEANAAMAARNPSAVELQAQRDAAAAEVRTLANQLQAARTRGTATKAIEDALSQARDEAGRLQMAQAFKGSEADRLSLSGMSDADAAAEMAALSPARLLAMEALAARVDAINARTLAALEAYGLMSKQALDDWRSAYRFYIPLHRDEAHPDSASHPIGQGFSVKGDAARQRVGSNAKVTHILGHIAMQREAALTRGEKNHVVKQLYLMAAQNPDADFWSVQNLPTTKTVDPASGFVRTGVDPRYKTMPNVVMVRIAGKDAAITFNERNPQAARLAEAIKNLDVGDLHYVLGALAKATRWFASVNTQYNPIFGLINFARDIQSSMLTLSTTPISGKQKEVAAGVFGAMRAIYRTERGKTPAAGPWPALWQDLQDMGGTTGYRELYADPADRAKSLLNELQAMDRGQVSKAAHAIADWLSDYNETMENAVRLSAYKVALDSGMSKPKAASLAKNLTVNFNRKGRQTREIGALYAFFNASMQGTTRLVETLRGPIGKRIMYGGVLLGVANTLLGMAVMGAGGGDDDNWDRIPDFIKERSAIIPISGSDYITIPLPLGFNVFPNIGRIATEFAFGGSEKPLGRQVGKLLSVLVDSFNPMGSAQDVWQMAAPTVADPVVALMQNRDWTGKPIYRENNSPLEPKPGHAMVKDSASTPSRLMAKAINNITGGTEYRPGAWSPTPDQIDFVIGQLTGGVGRELLKVNQTLAAPFTGDELPAYKIPLAGRLYGNTRGTAGQAEAFYENVKLLNELEAEVKGRSKNRQDVEAFRKEEPLTSLIGLGNAAERQVQGLREQRRRTVEQAEEGYKQRVQEIDASITEAMKRLNSQVAAKRNAKEPAAQ